MSTQIRAIQFGCGPIGCAVAKLASQRSDIKIVGAVDIDKNKVGRDLSNVMGTDPKIGIPITDNVDQLLATVEADVVFHQTGSFLKIVAPQLIRLLRLGLNIVSTTEELAYPFIRQPDLAQKIDAVAKKTRLLFSGPVLIPAFLWIPGP
jgi:4-hydroxy-tetrahydrodipicolinate reductase